MHNDQTYETKAAPGAADAMNDFLATFEAFQQTNDERLGELEKRGTADVVTSDRLTRIEAALDQHKSQIDGLALKAARLPIGDGGSDRADGPLAHKAAFDGYVRKGETGPFSLLERKALSVGSEADGGYLVPDETERAVTTALRSVSPIRTIAGVRQISSTVYKRPFAISGAGAGWVGEAAERGQTTTPGLAELAFPTMELYAMPAATSSLLEDSRVDIEAWLADEVRTAFAAQEGAAFVNGDGVSKPKGLLAYTTVANSAWTWGKIGTIATGVDGGLPASDAADTLIDLIYALKAPYRDNARFLVNRLTQTTLRKMKDGDGNYLWQPAAIAGQPATLMGFPVTEAEEMPDIAPDSLSIAFGDFQRGYLVVDRVGIRVLRDHYSAKPYVLFYTTKRVGGGVLDFDAIKLLKFSAT